MPQQADGKLLHDVWSPLGSITKVPPDRPRRDSTSVPTRGSVRLVGRLPGLTPKMAAQFPFTRQGPRRYEPEPDVASDLLGDDTVRPLLAYRHELLPWIVIPLARARVDGLLLVIS